MRKELRARRNHLGAVRNHLGRPWGGNVGWKLLIIYSRLVRLVRERRELVGKLRIAE